MREMPAAAANFGDEHVGQVSEGQGAVDRVVIGDRHEVHAPALGQLVDLDRLGGAFRNFQRTLHSELGDVRGGGVHMQVGPTHLVHGTRITLQTGGSVKNEVTFCNDLVIAGMGLVGHGRTMPPCLCPALGSRIRSS